MSVEIITAIALFAGVSLFSIYLFFRISALEKRMNRHSSNLQLTEGSLLNRIKHLEDNYSDGNSKNLIEKLRKDLADKYDNSIKELKEETTKLLLKGGAPRMEALTDEKIIKTLYAPTSNSKGEFRDDELSDKPQRNTFFEIFVLSNSEKAIVTIFEGLVFDPGILSASDQYFGYVCTFDNKWKESFSRLMVLEPGRLRKSGQGWMIQEKIRVQFE